VHDLLHATEADLAPASRGGLDPIERTMIWLAVTILWTYAELWLLIRWPVMF